MTSGIKKRQELTPKREYKIPENISGQPPPEIQNHKETFIVPFDNEEINKEDIKIIKNKFIENILNAFDLKKCDTINMELDQLLKGGNFQRTSN